MSSAPPADQLPAVRRNWVVVANASRARVLEVSDETGTLTHQADLVHTGSRLKDTQLAQLHGGDRPGHVEGTGHGLGSASYIPRTHPHEREADRFAREVAQVVNQGVAEGRCAGVTLVAAQAFLGRLRARLDPAARRAVLRSVAHDYTALDERTLAERLAGEARLV